MYNIWIVKDIVPDIVHFLLIGYRQEFFFFY